MKLYAFFVASAITEAATLDRRQGFSLSSLFGGKGSASPKVSQGTVFKTLQAEYDAKAKREFKLWGPYKLGASNGTHAPVGFSAGGPKLDPNSDSLGSGISPPCTDCTILKAVANLAYADGKQADVANGVYTHHIIISQNGRKQLFMPLNPPSCPGQGLGSLFGGAGKGPAPATTANGAAAKGAKGAGEKTAAAPAASGHSHGRRQTGKGFDFSSLLPAISVFLGGGGSAGSGSAFVARQSEVKSGVYIGKTDTFSFSSEIVNYDPREKDIYLSMDYEWVPGKTPGLLDVGMGALSSDDCFNPTGQFIPPKDKAQTYKGGEWTVTDNGYFVNFTPHLHDGGVRVNVFLNGKQICESKAIYGAAAGSATVAGQKWETISSYTPCETANYFKKGDKVYMTAEYDLTKYKLRPDSVHNEMGAEAMALTNFIWAKAAS